MSTIPTSEPTRFAQGDSLSWTKRLADYSPDDGWILHYAAVQSGQAAIVIDGTDNGDGTHLLEIDPEDSEDFAIGDWRWQAYVTKGTPVTERKTILWGGWVVDPDFAIQTTGYDGRSQVKKDLDTLNAAITAKIAGGDVSSYSISSGSGSRSLARVPYDELVRMRDRLRAEYAREQRREARANGKDGGFKILTRFV